MHARHQQTSGKNDAQPKRHQTGEKQNDFADADQDGAQNVERVGAFRLGRIKRVTIDAFEKTGAISRWLQKAVATRTPHFRRAHAMDAS
jgi:hypothetical protein